MNQDERINIEIYNRSTGEVVERTSVSNERRLMGFVYYYTMQCNTDLYAWREVTQ